MALGAGDGAAEIRIYRAMMGLYRAGILAEIAALEGAQSRADSGDKVEREPQTRFGNILVPKKT